MAWEYSTAADRIDKLLSSVPAVTVEQFSDRVPLILEARASKGLAGEAKTALVDIPRNRAVLVDGVHVYANLINYNDYRLESDAENEQSHARALNFLHLHYQATDRLLQDFGAQRVDFHGGRMHCVIVDPIDDARQRSLKALELAHRLSNFLHLSSRELAHGDFEPALRVGIDSGICIAVNNGIGSEHEPLFLGGAANHAAHLAEGDVAGIYTSSRFLENIGQSRYQDESYEKVIAFDENRRATILSEAALRADNPLKNMQPYEVQSARLIADWRSDIELAESATAGVSQFQFSTYELPLSTLEFKKLSPSNSIRMEMASIFADVDGYTAFINECQVGGDASTAVRALHVIRGELSRVLTEDFFGRKVRFIGDCVHGILSAGTGRQVDSEMSVREAIACGAGMRSSFEIVQRRLPEIAGLGLAIGIDFGSTPLSRIGIRGERSVRVASSRATINSQDVQDKCDGSELALGQAAYDCLPGTWQNLFQNGPVKELDYETYLTFFNQRTASVHAHNPKVRAHSSNNY